MNLAPGSLLGKAYFVKRLVLYRLNKKHSIIIPSPKMDSDNPLAEQKFL